MTSTTSDRTVCFTCNKEKITYFCQGCLNRFCLNHLNTHRQNLHQELDQIQTDHDQLRQNLNEEKSNPDDHGLIKQIDQWEQNSIEKIKQTAQQCRLKWTNYSDEYLDIMEKKINDFAQQIKQMNAEDEFNEIDLNHLKEKLEKLEGELHRPNNVSIKEQSSSFIAEISLLLPLHKGKTKNIYEKIHSIPEPLRYAMETIWYNNSRRKWSRKPIESTRTSFRDLF